MNNTAKSDARFIFDRTLREILQGIPKRFIELLTGKTVIELLEPNFPKVEERNADFLVRLNDNTIFHLEVQAQDDPKMAFRMLKYYLLIRELYSQSPFQMVLWVGDNLCPIKGEINETNLFFKFLVKDIKEMNCEILLDSEDPNDNSLRYYVREKKGLWERLFQKISQLPEKQREDYIRKIIYMVKLRKQAIAEFKDYLKEAKNMPIVIDMRQDPMFKEGFEEGSIMNSREAILGVLERKFGVVNENIANKINSINSRDILMSLLWDAVKAENIEEFEDKISKTIM